MAAALYAHDPMSRRRYPLTLGAHMMSMKLLLKMAMIDLTAVVLWRVIGWTVPTTELSANGWPSAPQ